MFKITTSTGNDVTIEDLMADYPDLYAADESGFEVYPQDMMDNPEGVADAGYGGRETRRILFWAPEQDSENNPSMDVIAKAVWAERQNEQA